MTRENARPTGKLYFDLASGLTLFVGKRLMTNRHRHYTASITVTLDEPFRVRSGPEWERGFRDAWCMLAAPNAEHQLEAPQSTLLNMQIDPESQAYPQLLPLDLEQRPLQLLDAARSEPLAQRLRPLVLAGEVRVDACWNALVEGLGGQKQGRRVFDARVARALALLKREFPETRPSSVLAEKLGLSEDRLIRLFSKEVGVPLRRYVLWLRLRHVMFRVGAGKNLTDAANEAGFADSAHLTRVFRDMFGIAPTALLRAPDVSLHVVLPSGQLSGPHASEDRSRLVHLEKGSPWTHQNVKLKR